jgi:hypothetical protein
MCIVRVFPIALHRIIKYLASQIYHSASILCRLSDALAGTAKLLLIS